MTKRERKVLPLAVMALHYKLDLNINTLIRSAEIFGAREFIIVSNKSREEIKITPKRTGGAMYYLPILFFQNMEEAFNYVREKGYKIIAVEQWEKAKKTYEIETYPEPACFVLGRENTGIPEKVLEKADLVVEIPQLGITNSLNTAMAGTIILYDFVMKNYFRRNPANPSISQSHL